MKKFYLFLFIALLSMNAFAQAWDGTTKSPWTQGDGSEKNPFVIEKPEQLAFLSQKVREKETFEGKFFILAKDLDMGGKEFTPIGLYDKGINSETNEVEDGSFYFKGVFDGNHHIIDNLLITKATKTSGSIQGQETSLGGLGLFACSYTTTIIRNVTLGKGCKIDVKDQVVASLIGVMEGGLLENSQNLGSVKGEMIVGGLVASMPENAKVIHCLNKGTVEALGMECGGIVAHMEKNSIVQGCYNTGSITSPSYFSGGIVGQTFDKSVVKNCYNIGAVKGKADFMAKPHAIIGENDKKTAVVANNYFVVALSLVGDESATAKTEEEMKAPEMLPLLNKDDAQNPFISDSKNKNQGFPILAWENEEPKEVIITSLEAPCKGMPISIHKRTLSSPINMKVINLEGYIIGQGKEIILAEKGIYIVLQEGRSAMKILVE